MSLNPLTFALPLDNNWKVALQEEFNAPYFQNLKNFLAEEKKHYEIFPPFPQVFAAFNQTPFDNLKVVIIGQDPYHGTGQAHGLSFSVAHGVKPPPSLVNIFKEIKFDTGLIPPSSGNLEHWAKQGVLLLNATLTVRANQAGSHQKKGWENFTDATIKKISDAKEGIIFLLWGKFAQQKEAFIDSSKHYILKAAHPSPFSAHNGFFGCRHFSKTNDLLKIQGKAEINWAMASSLQQ
jgi:uracil-DNA glycosylase